MKMTFRSCLTVLLMLALCMFTASALAEQPTVTVGVTVTLEGTLPDPAEVFTIQLKALDPANPMPEGSVDGVAETTITGAGKGALPAITFTRVGIYEYTVSQLPGSIADCVYDASVYSLTVYVVNAESYDGLEATAVLYRNGEGDKMSEAVFNNVYPTITPKPTDDPGEITATGVRDVWPIYLAGAALLLIISGLLAVSLRRKDGNRGRRAE